jgi:hypothetical protein
VISLADGWVNPASRLLASLASALSNNHKIRGIFISFPLQLGTRREFSLIPFLRQAQDKLLRRRGTCPLPFVRGELERELEGGWRHFWWEFPFPYLIPVKTGIQELSGKYWIPAFAGMAYLLPLDEIATSPLAPRNDSKNKKGRLLRRPSLTTKNCLIPTLKQVKPSTISTAKLNALLHLHMPPIKQVVYLRSYSCPRRGRMGDLILGWASHLDAFSAYPFQT